MGSFGGWLKALFTGLVNAMSSIFGFFLSVLGWFIIPDTTHLRPWVIGVGVAALLFSSYRAWASENSARSKAESEFSRERLLREGPDVLVEVLPAPQGRSQFAVKNVGGQTATCVAFGALADNVELVSIPRLVPSLEVGAQTFLQVSVRISLSDYQGETSSLVTYLRKSPLPVVMHLNFKDSLGKRTFVRKFSVEGNRDGIAFLPVSLEIL